MTCATCGADNPVGRRFCTACGTPLASGSPSPGQSPPVSGDGPAAPGPAKATSHLSSLLWIAIPTLVYGYLVRNVTMIVALAAFGVVLKFAEGRREVPAMVRPFLRYLQAVAAYVLLGGSVVPVAIAAVLGVLVARNVKALVPALEPWWRIQQRWPRLVRMVLGIIVTFFVGYECGSVAGGSEWTMTFVSMISGTLVMFLFTFDPPADARHPSQGRPAARLG